MPSEPRSSQPGDADQGRDDERAARELHLEQVEFQVELERAAVEEVRGERDLEGVFLDLLYTGVEVRVFVAGRSWMGQVVHVAAALVTVREGSGVEVDVVLDRVAAVQVVRQVTGRGRSRIAREPGSLVERLQELLVDEARVRVGGAGCPEVEGVVDVLGDEHVELLGPDRSSWMVAIAAIDYLVRVPEPRPRWAGVDRG